MQLGQNPRFLQEKAAITDPDQVERIARGKALVKRW